MPKTSTNQDKKQGNPNPSPATRFGAENGNPISPGGWKKEDSISYQYNFLMRLPPEELWVYKPKTVAQEIALARLRAARDTRLGLADAKEVTDRTEGKAAQAIDLTSSDGSMTPTVIIEGVYANKPNFRPDNQNAEADDVAADGSSESS